MAKVLGDLVFPNEKYMKDGVEKTKWLNCGIVLQKDDGSISVKINCLPINMQEGWFNVFAPREDNRQAQAQQSGFRGGVDTSKEKAPLTGADFEKDDIPF
jgi:hypothetical protein